MFRWGAHWRHFANTTEPSMCGSNAACYFDHFVSDIAIFVLKRDVKLQLTYLTYFDHLLLLLKF